MNSDIKKIAIIGTMFLFIVLLASCTEENKEESNIKVNEVKKVKTVETVEEANTNILVNQGVLADYSPKALSEAKGDIVLFFHASWCSICRASKNDIIEKGVPEGLTILIADYDEETELKEKYGVTTQTTFVQVDNEGNMIKKWVGGKLDKIIEEVSK